jgi:hypothetical protein
MTQTSPDTCAAFVGLDGAAATPDGCLQTAGSAKRECFQRAHTPAAIAAGGPALRTRVHGPPVALCRERHTGPLGFARPKADVLGRFPITPLPLARSRAACPPRRANDAPSAAALPRALRLTPRDPLQPRHPHSPPCAPAPSSLPIVVAWAGTPCGFPTVSPGRGNPLARRGCTGCRTQRPPCAGTVCAAGPPAQRPSSHAVPPWPPASVTTPCAQKTCSHSAATPSRSPAVAHRCGWQRPPGPGGPRACGPALRPLAGQRRLRHRHCAARPDPARLPALPGPPRRGACLRSPPPRRRWRTTCPLCRRRRPAKIGGHGTAHRTQRQAILGALASPVSPGPATTGRGLGRRIEPAGRLGTGLFPAATRAGASASGRCAGPRFALAPPPVAVLAGAYPLPGVRLAPGTQPPWVRPDPQACAGVLTHRKKTLTAPLRACVRPCVLPQRWTC